MKNAAPESPKAMKKSHTMMKVSGMEKVKHSGAPPKGYGSNGTKTAGSKKGRG